MAKFQDQDTAIVTCNREGVILSVDSTSTDVFPVDLDAMIGTSLNDYIQLTSGQSVAQHLDGVSQAMQHNAQGKSIVADLKRCNKKAELVVWGLSQHEAIVDGEDVFLCHFHLVNDSTNGGGLSGDRPLLEIVDGLQQDFIANRGAYYVFGRALQALLEFTVSEYGFIGEILKNHDGTPYLQTHAITNIAWNKDVLQFFEEHAPSGLAFFNNNTLFGHTVLTGEVVIANDPANDEKAGGVLPEGHPGLYCYLGLPIYCGDKLIGMAGIANRKGGYAQALVDELRVLLNTLGVLIKVYQQEKLSKLAQAQLLLQARQLDEANQAKSRFLASMSHELRTPLNAIIGFSQRLLSAYESSMQGEELESKALRRQYESVGAINRNGQHLLGVIQDLLDLANLEVGRVELKFETIQLYELLSGMKVQIQNLLEQNQVKFEFQCKQDAVIYADVVRLKHILFNIVSNSVELAKNQVKLSAERAKWLDESVEFSGWRILVVDDGDEMNEEQQKLLLQPYVQTKGEHRKIGAGLGLVVSQEYAKLHQGRITLESDSNGTRVMLIIPDQLPGNL